MRVEKLHIHSVLCDGCLNHQWRWYCIKGHGSSVSGVKKCEDYVGRVAEVVNWE